MKDLDFNIEDQRSQKNFQIVKDEIEENEDDISAIFSYGSGAPGSSITSRFYLDETNNRLYVRYSDGTYKYSSLS